MFAARPMSRTVALWKPFSRKTSIAAWTSSSRSSRMSRVWHVGGAALLARALPPAAQTQGVTADSVTIGAFGPITGPAAYIGLAGRDGMSLAVKEINAAGGVNGRKINVVFEDDAHSPTR